MKVYITFENNKINKIFLNQGDARCSVVTEEIVNKVKTGEEFKKELDELIEEHEVLEQCTEFKLNI